jgi:hypothetical protein
MVHVFQKKYYSLENLLLIVLFSFKGVIYKVRLLQSLHLRIEQKMIYQTMLVLDYLI